MSIRKTYKRTIRTLSHCYYDLKYHFVWTPKYRGKVLDDDKTKQELTRIFNSISKWKQMEIIELNIQIDHNLTKTNNFNLKTI